MNVEQEIQQLFSDQNSDIDADNFINNLHRTREKRLQNKHRLTYGISSFVVVLLVGLISLNQLNNGSTDMQLDYYLSADEMSEEMTEDYYEELMIYLADHSEDVWSTMEFYYEVNNESINTEE